MHAHNLGRLGAIIQRDHSNSWPITYKIEKKVVSQNSAFSCIRKCNKDGVPTKAMSV